jgi:cysteinylglycine-S-conjugate dipeptidase
MRKIARCACAIGGMFLFVQTGKLGADTMKEKEGSSYGQFPQNQLTKLYLEDDEFDAAVHFLGELVAIPTVSNPNSPDYHVERLEEAAECIATKLKNLGFTASCLSVEGSPPYVLAEAIVDAAKPTLLLYAHYDVQPVDRKKWVSDPFIMEERNGRLYGRGASDDKAGIVSIIMALEAYQKKAGVLPINIKLLFEGEEEYSSSHMKSLLALKQSDLQANALIVLDGLNRDVGTGTLTSSTRGLVNIHLKVSALKNPIHSGLGCLVPDPAQGLTSLIYSLRDPKAIPGFFDDCLLLNEQERKILAQGSQSAESYAEETGVLEAVYLRGNPEESVYERIVQEPSISIVNMNCGQPNGGNSIQDSASCTIGIRLTPGQSPDRVADAVIHYLQSQDLMHNLVVEVSRKEQGAWPWKADLTGPFSTKYFEALGENFLAASAMPCGGALPLLHDFEEVFPAMEMIVPAVEDPYTSAHSHNESQDKAIFRNAINSLIAFFYKAGKGS